MQRVIYVVVGMHRSGTSVLTRGLKALGIDLGDRLLAPLPSNPSGFWEDIDTLDIDEMLLETGQRRWFSARPIDPATFSSASSQELLNRAERLLGERYRTRTVWAFKDPRVCRLLAFWQRAFERQAIEDRYVVVVRNPLSVAQSLQHRDGFAPGKSFVLWTSHMLAALQEIEKRPHVFVAYEALMEHPVEQMRRIATAFEITLNPEIDAELENFATSFVSRDLEHHVAASDAIDRDTLVPNETRRLYGLLRRLCQEGDASTDPNPWTEFASLAKAWFAQDRLFALMDDQDAAYMAMRKRLFDAHEGERDKLERQLNQTMAAVQSGAESELRLSADLAQRTEELARRTGELAQRDDELTQRTYELSRRSDELARLGQEIAARKSELAAQAAQLRERDVAIGQLSARLGELTAQVEQLQGSASVLAAALEAEGRKVTEASAALERSERTLSERTAELDKSDRTLSQRTAEFEVTLRDLRGEIAELVGARRNDAERIHQAEEKLAQLRIDKSSLVAFLNSLEFATRSLLGSMRWRIGNRIGEFRRILTARARVPLASDAIFATLQAFHDWEAHDQALLSRPQSASFDEVLGGLRAAPLRRSVRTPPGGAADADGDVAALPDRLSGAPRVSVIVPVFNAYEQLRECMTALQRNSASVAELLLIDDASTDLRVGELLAQWAAMNGACVLRNEQNLGFTATVNRGIAATEGDVVLLNSDTVVGPRWLENLRVAAYSRPRVATVTAISDNAGAFSFPEAGRANRLPPSLAAVDIARAIMQREGRMQLEVPTGNGFCMYVRREVIQQIGAFDEKNFPVGYGEENDFSMRALKAGFVNLINDATYVLHREGASFGNRRVALTAEAQQTLARLHPEYASLVADAFASPRMHAARLSVAEALQAASASTQRPRPRVLVLLHQAVGGMPRTAMDIVACLDGRFQSFVLTSDGTTLRMFEFANTRLELLHERQLQQPVVDCRLPNASYRAAIVRVMRDYAIELVHMHHVLSHSLDAADAAHALGIPLVVSLHDFFFICPSLNLLDEKGVFCRGKCTAGEGRCRVPFPTLARIPGLKHGWISNWQVRLGGMLCDASALVVPHDYVKQVYLDVYPDLDPKRVHVIEHGRDLRQQLDIAEPPSANEKIRILFPGNLDWHKGSEYIRRLAAIDRGRRLELNFLGRIPAELDGIGRNHGTYQAGDFVEQVRAIRPSFIGVFSIWSETYCYVLTEAWACGVPVLTLDIGVQAERVRRHGGGWVLDLQDPEVAYRQILAIADDSNGYIRELGRATLRGIRTAPAMAADYEELYRATALAQRRSASPAATSMASSPARRFRLGLALPKVGEAPTASAFVRILQPLEQTEMQEAVSAAPLPIERFLSSAEMQAYDAILVQRDALPRGMATVFAARCRERGIPLIFEIDDDLFAVDARHPDYSTYAAHAEDLTTLARAADLVTVSTVTLAETCKRYNARVVVVPNALDDLLWFSGAGASAGASPEATAGEILLLYVGTTTHGEDLRLLRAALEQIGSDGRMRVRCHVIGGEPAGPGQEWYERIEIPPDRRDYPRFVPWLRAFAGKFHIALAPLASGPMNRAKSNLKYLEYAALGVPGIYSAEPAYATSVRHGVTGWLAANTPDAWAQSIRILAGDAPLREKLAANAYDDVVAHHRASLLVDAWQRALVSVRDRA